MSTKEFVTSIVDRKAEEVFPDLIASAVSSLSFFVPIHTVSTGMGQEGEVVVARVRAVNRFYPLLETVAGEGVELRQDQIIVGVLGSRRALRGFSGRVPGRLRPGMSLYLVNKGGVIGECTAFHRDLGWPTQVEYLGSVSQQGRPLNLKDRAFPLLNNSLPDVPIVMVLGTCMNAGKTAACKQILRLFTEKGFSVNAGKVAGVACLQDTVSMTRCGAKKVLSFLDFGLPSTTHVGDLAPIARSLLGHLSQPKPDFIVLEMGDGILGGYNVASLFEDAGLMSRCLCLVLCANDLMGAWGGIQWMSQKGRGQVGCPLLISGPVTDSAEGVRYIEENWDIPAANALDSGGKICTFILDVLMPWLKSV